MKRIKIGSQVLTEAWSLARNPKCQEDCWSYAWVFGVAVKRSGEKFTKKWNIDGEECDFQIDVLYNEIDSMEAQDNNCCSAKLLEGCNLPISYTYFITNPSVMKGGRLLKKI